MTVNILTVGHIKCLEYLCSNGIVFVGLLTPKALKGYKKEITPYKDRKYILETLEIPFTVVPQNSLNPEKNLQKYGCNFIASGDGWEKAELEAIRKLGIKIINIKLKGEKTKKYSASKLLNKIK